MNIIKEKREWLGKLLKSEREKRKWSLGFVERKLKDKMNAKTSKPSIHRLEMGITEKINPILLKNLCKIYELDTEEIFRNLEYLDDANIKKKKDFNGDENLVSIKIFKNIEDAANYPSIGIKELCSTSIPFKKFSKTPSSLVGALIEENNESIQNELTSSIEWVVIAKDIEILNGEIGVFLYQNKYIIKKKIISTTSKIILMGNDNNAILIEEKDKLKEIGKVVYTFSKIEELEKNF